MIWFVTLSQQGRTGSYQQTSDDKWTFHVPYDMVCDAKSARKNR